MPNTTGLADGDLPTTASAWLVLLVILAAVVGTATISPIVETSTMSDPRSESRLVFPAATSAMVTPVTTTTLIATGACTVTISSRRTALHREPDSLSSEVLSVPAGAYPVAASHSLVRGTEQRWLLIDVAGTQGWVRDLAADVAATSPECA